jgi:hypothetical protein
MTNRSKSTLFLIEQLIVIAVFAMCAVACISILTAAYFNANDTRSVSHAVLKAQSGAEVFKATGGDFEAMADILGGSYILDEYNGVPGFVFVIYYDDTWLVCGNDNATYRLIIRADEPRVKGDITLKQGSLTVSRMAGGELISLSVTARG